MRKDLKQDESVKTEDHKELEKTKVKKDKQSKEETKERKGDKKAKPASNTDEDGSNL